MITFNEFIKVWETAYLNYGKELKDTQIKVHYSALKNFSKKQLMQAVSAHISDSNEGRFPPLPAHIIGQLESVQEKVTSNDGRLGAEEAWAEVIHLTEDSTMVWTEEMSQAYFTALPLIEEGDKIAGRMAFKEKYLSELAKARSENKPLKWIVSLGHEPISRQDTLKKAVELGRIGRDHAVKLLPSITFSSNAKKELENVMQETKKLELTSNS